MDVSESIVSIVGGEGWDNIYDEISNFKEHLDLKEGSVAEERVEFGWLLWNSDHKTQLQHRIKNLFRHIAYDPCFYFYYLVQFWAVEEEGQNRTFLSTAHQPFSVGNLTEGLARYRKICADRVLYVAGEEGREPVGGVGRAYRNGYPESTPDLRLYSREEFPMRDEAARSRLRGYLALPLYELYSDECCGVLEFVSASMVGAHELSSLDQGMQSAGLRSTHTNFVHISKSKNSMPDKYKQQGESEIGEALRLAMATVPRLHFAQVWVPCKQCAANSICMERACFVNVDDATDFNSCKNVDDDMFVYIQACEFHNLQVLDPADHCLSCQNLCDLGISKNPLAHYAKKARLSHRFAVSLQRVGGGEGERRVIELFLHQNSSREGDDRHLHLVLRIMEAKLKNFEFVDREQFPEEPSAQPRQLVDMLNIDMDMESFSELSDFTEYVDTLDSYACCLLPSSKDDVQGWAFRMEKTENDSEGVLVRERTENFMKKIAEEVGGEYWIVQFWAPQMVGGRCYLQASDQAYAVGCLAKRLASLRKKCNGHRYFVDEEAGEEEVGPPGRVFRIGIHETTPDLSLYSTKEFPIKAYAVNCYLQQYSALPVFNNERRDKCVGVLELIGVPISSLNLIKRVLEEARLCSTHIDFSLIFAENDNTLNISNGKEQALSEMRVALDQMKNIPQLHMAKVWIPNSETCSTLGCTNARCMELAVSTNDFLTLEYMSKNQVHWIHVKSGKGMIGMVLDSESKSCFCRNLYEFSIADQPLVHYQRKERLDACFAISLQSSHTGGDFPYVIEFFLYQTHEYLVSFLNFLIPVMNQQLKSFEYASGKPLVEEMVVEVVEFSRGDNATLTFCEQGQPQYPFPIKFKSVSYSHSQEGEDDEPMQRVLDVMQTEEIKSSACPKETKNAKGKTGSRLNFEDLKPHFGRKLEDVAVELDVGRSTIKRVCRENGIKRWPSNKKNPSLLERENGRDSHKGKSSIIVEEEEEVMMKVTYKEDTIKFKLRLSLGVNKVLEEVALGLNLKMSTFKLKYLDEDNEKILLARDVDFQHCPRFTTASGVRCIKLFVQLISD